MTTRKRILSTFLALVMVFSLLPSAMVSAAGTATYQGNKYSTDYTTWQQTDPAWANTPLGNVHTLGGSGCLISSIAILMCHSGTYDPASMNPGVLRDWLDSKGCISHSDDRSKDALLSFGLITPSISPRFYFISQEFFPTTTPISEVSVRIGELIASGYQVVARVKNSGHFVAVANTISGDARIYDPGYTSKKLLSEYNGTIGGLIWFKANTSGKDTILPQFAGPSAPVITNFADTYGSGDSISITWNNANLATHYNVYVEQKQTDGSWKANYRYHFYATSPFTEEPLPAGTYRVKVQAANSNTKDWTYANSEYKEFTVKDGYLTVTYNANGGTVSPISQLVKQGSVYDLPTPKKTGAAFLGWYDANGRMVNRTTAISGTKGHTLTAKWTTSGVGFTASTTYNNCFTDVPQKAWYYTSIASVYAYNLMNGVEKTKFMPNDEVTAAQTVTLAARMRKLYLTGDGTFAATSPWHKAYSDYAISQKIISSVPADMNGTFTRQEFASMLANALPADALPAINTVNAGDIPDVYRSDTAVYTLYRAGIFAGNDAAGTFRPNAPITRAEVAAVLVRMADPNQRMLFTLH